MPATKTFSVRLPDDLRTDVDQLADITNRSRSFVINEAVRTYTASRLAYLRELDEAVAAIDTQPTYEAKDVLEWMATWGTDKEKPLAEANISARK